ncbi:MAG: hypothetical protein CHACPFDD_00446 [Phycisphaerae bacterium]|nr:hypothetical protein [Phycisphaerae bacterium]
MKNPTRTIADLQSEIAACFARMLQERGSPEPLRRPGLRPRVTIRTRKTDRKRRQTAQARFEPDEDCIVIEFERDEGQSGDAVGGTASSADGATLPPAGVPEQHLADLIRALDGVERQGRAFVSLVWFRDNVLSTYPWATDPGVRQSAMTEASHRRLFETSKVSNPKNPQFPVTAIRLRRDEPLVRETLRAGGGAPVFRPIRIEGEPLSATLIRERRESR